MAPPRLQHGIAGVPRHPWGHQGLRTGPLRQSEPRKPEKPQAKPDNLISTLKSAAYLAEGAVLHCLRMLGEIRFFNFYISEAPRRAREYFRLVYI